MAANQHWANAEANFGRREAESKLNQILKEKGMLFKHAFFCGLRKSGRAEVSFRQACKIDQAPLRGRISGGIK